MMAHLMREALDKALVKQIADLVAGRLRDDQALDQFVQQLTWMVARYDAINKLMVKTLNKRPDDPELQHT